MKTKITSFLVVICLLSVTCKNASNPIPKDETGEITSQQYIDKLLFVDANGFQIQTSEAATFSSADPRLQMTSSGYITRLTTGEIAEIEVTWTKSGEKTKLYALGARGDNYDEPNASFNGLTATESFNSCVQGWKTLQKLPITDATYVIVLRHSDANNGKDFSLTTGPENWWKSKESKDARQLNAQGIARSTELGNVFRDLKFPIARVITSEFYRARQTAELINVGPILSMEASINHPQHNNGDLFSGMLAIVKNQPVDNKMTLIISHHPINEVRKNTAPGFPAVIPFPWTGAYLVRVAADKSLTYEGAVSYPMLKYWRDLKFNKL